MESQKTILWVEDFANDSDLVPDGYDFLNEKTPDRTEQIKELFPPYLVDMVQVVEDPTKLPNYMQKYGKNYEFIILDVNFEVGISQLQEDIDALTEEMRKARIKMPPITQPNTVKKLGYYLYFYLREKWQVPTENIVFFSAYCDEDTASGFRNQFDWPIEPLFFDKKDNSKMGEYLSKRLSPDQITDEAAIVQAKMLFNDWAENGVPEDSILRKVAAKPQNKSSHTGDAIIKKIRTVLNEANYKNGQNEYYKILRETTFAFETEIDFETERGWHRKVYLVLKWLRNSVSHRGTTNLSASEFLLMFAVALRAIFEPTSQPVNNLKKSEEWLINVLKQITSKKRVVSRLDEKQLNVRIEETMLQWYLRLESKVHFIGDVYCMSRTPQFRDQDNLENVVVQIFCIWAMNARFVFKPRIMSSFSENQRYPDYGPETTVSPSILCLFQSCDNPKRDGSSLVPKTMESLARAYICSQLEYEMNGSDSFKINL